MGRSQSLATGRQRIRMSYYAATIFKRTESAFFAVEILRHTFFRPSLVMISWHESTSINGRPVSCVVFTELRIVHALQ
jgi:hypothetical protein